MGDPVIAPASTTRVGPARHETSDRISWPIVLWSIYLALAPIAWLPGIEQPVMSAVRAVAFAAAVITTWVAGRDRGLPSGILGLFGLFALLVAAMPAAFQASTRMELGQGLYSLVLPFVTLWAFWRLPQLNGDMRATTVVALVTSAGLSILVIFSTFTEPSWLSSETTAAWLSGFGVKRTGWSHHMAVLVPFFMMRALSGAPRHRLLALLGMASVIGGQIAVGGRGGWITSTIVVALALAFYFSPRAMWTTLLAVVLVSIPLLILVADEPTRYEPVGPRLTAFDTLDELSTGRLQLMTEGWSLLAEKPLTGQGFGRDSVYLGARAHQVHITWLRMAVQGGILFPLVMFSIVVSISYLAWKNYAQAAPNLRLVHMATGLAILTGVAGSFVEPTAITGSFHGAALWWAAAGTAARTAAEGGTLKQGREDRYWLSTRRSGPDSESKPSSFAERPDRVFPRQS